MNSSVIRNSSTRTSQDSISVPAAKHQESSEHPVAFQQESESKSSQKSDSDGQSTIISVGSMPDRRSFISQQTKFRQTIAAGNRSQMNQVVRHLVREITAQSATTLEGKKRDLASRQVNGCLISNFQ